MKSNDRAGVIHQRRHKDFSRFDQGAVDDPATNNMDAVDLLFDIKGDDAELLHRFALEVEDGFERVIADQGTGDPPAFKVVAAALGTDLFEGVDVVNSVRKSALIFRRLVDIVRPKMYNKININIIKNNLVHERESNAPYKINGREDCKDYSRI
jgi:hypothetical protein